MKQNNPFSKDNSMICRYFKVLHRDMVYLKFILEAYEGMNVMSTVDNKVGIIRIAIMSGFENDMDTLLSELSKQLWMESVEWKPSETTIVFTNPTQYQHISTTILT